MSLFLHQKFSITSLAHQWIICSEWVPSEWEFKQLIKHYNNRLGRHCFRRSAHKNVISIYAVGENKPFELTCGDLVKCLIFTFCYDFDRFLLGAMLKSCCVEFCTSKKLYNVQNISSLIFIFIWTPDRLHYLPCNDLHNESLVPSPCTATQVWSWWGFTVTLFHITTK